MKKGIQFKRNSLIWIPASSIGGQLREDDNVMILADVYNTSLHRVKGMFRWLRNMFRPRLEPMNVIRIHKDRILYNYGLLQGLHPEGHIFPVLKSNAYGHGLKEVLRIIERLPVLYVVVDSIPEYYIVKNNSKHHMLLM